MNTRREFLKKLGIGVAGVGVVSACPALAKPLLEKKKFEPNDDQTRFLARNYTPPKKKTVYATGHISGTVVEHGKPVKGMQINIYDQKTMKLVHTAVTDHTGWYGVWNLPMDGKYTVMAINNVTNEVKTFGGIAAFREI